VSLRRLAIAFASLGCIAATTTDRPQLVVQRAETNQFWSSASDEPVYLSVTPADHLNVWDARDGTLVRTVALPHQSTPWTSAESPAALVSGDGRFAAVRIDEDRIAIVGTADGNVAPLGTASTGTLFPLAFSPDASELAIDVEPPPDPRTGQPRAGHIALVAAADGKTLRTFAGTAAAAFSADGRELATLNDARDRLLLYDLDGNRVRTLRDGGGVYGPIVFSPDGTTVATDGDDPSIPPRGDGTYDPSSTAHDLVVKLWDVRGSRLRSRFSGMRTWQVNPLDERAPGTFAFADASTLAVGKDSAVTFYGTTSFAARARVDYAKAGSPGIFRVGGALRFIVRHDTTLSFERWNGRENVPYASVPFVGGFGNSLALDSGGRNLAIAATNGPSAAAAYRFDLRTLELAKLPLDPSDSKLLRFLSDGRLAFITPSEVTFVDMRTGAMTPHPVPAQRDPHAYVDVTTSGDGQTLFAVQPATPSTPLQPAPIVRAYDTATGKERFALSGVTRGPNACASVRPRCAFMGVESAPGVPPDLEAPVTLTVIDSHTGRRVSRVSLPPHADSVGFVDFGRALAVHSQAFAPMRRDSIAIVDPERGSLERTFATVDGLLTSCDLGPYIALAGNASVTVYDLSGRVVQTILDKPMPELDAIAFWPGGTKLAILHADGTIAVRDIASGQLLATFVFFMDSDALEWLAYTPDGYYTGTPYALRAIRWRSRDAILPADAFAWYFNRPERIAAALQ